MNEQLALKTIQQLFEDFQIFNEDFNTSHFDFNCAWRILYHEKGIQSRKQHSKNCK